MYEGDLRRFAVGPDGKRITIADLPAPDTKRWVPRIKVRIVAAVEGGLISRDQAIKRYRLCEEEFEAWKAAFSRFGLHGLKVTKISQNRALLSDGNPESRSLSAQSSCKSAARRVKS